MKTLEIWRFKRGGLGKITNDIPVNWAVFGRAEKKRPQPMEPSAGAKMF